MFAAVRHLGSFEILRAAGLPITSKLVMVM
jgi:hypothetical protein